AKRLEGDGKEAARRFAEDALAVLLVALLLITIAAELATPWLMLIFAPGFSEDPQKFDWAVEFTRITFPYLLFISLTALQSAILNSLGRFFPGAAAPVMLNVTLILAILFLVPLTDNPGRALADRKSTRLNSSHVKISYAVFCLKKKKKDNRSV